MKFSFSAIEIFGKTIPMYGVMCVLGLFFACLTAVLLATKKQKIEFFDFTLDAITTMIGAFIGAKLLFIIVSWGTVVDVFKTLPFLDAMLAIMQGGFVFYGGLIGGAVALFTALMVQKKDFFKTVDIYAVVLPLGHAFGRVGCFFSGCCYGMEYDGWLSFTYSTALDPSTPIGVPLLPTQLIEAGVLFVLFAALLIVYLKAPKHKGLCSLFYAYGYAVMRFVLEFFRADAERGLFLGLSTSQWISVAIFIAATVWLVLTIIKSKKKKQIKTEKSAT